MKGKDELELAKDGKTIRSIVKEVGKSSRDVIKILKKAEEKRSEEELEKQRQEEKNFSQSVYIESLKLYREGKSPLDVAIQLGIHAEEALAAHFEFLQLKVAGKIGVHLDTKGYLPDWLDHISQQKAAN
jgi:hypothetical protein